MASKKRANNDVGRSRFIATIGVLIIGVVVLQSVRSWLVSPVDPGSLRTVDISVAKGETSNAIGDELAEHGLIRDPIAFRFALISAAADRRIRPGEYDLSPSMTPSQMVDEMVSGVNPRSTILIPDGFTLDQIADRLQAHGVVSRTDFIAFARTQGRTIHLDDGFIPPSANLEGYLGPDTYEIAGERTPRQVCEMMVRDFDIHVVATHPDVSDWREPIIVASLVEREASRQGDRAPIASVIYNRLRIHMPLDIDATVQYALPRHKARLMYSDLKVQSPYNTYLHRGLPPTPICSPGIECIEAALHPAVTTYLYYVAGPGDKHIFTHNMAEHDAVIRKLRSGASEPPS